MTAVWQQCPREPGAKCKRRKMWQDNKWQNPLLAEKWISTNPDSHIHTASLLCKLVNLRFWQQRPERQ